MAKKRTVVISDEIKHDRAVKALNQQVVLLKRKYKEAVKQLDAASRESEVASLLEGTVATHTIHPKTPSGTSEAVAFMIASDWHLEENVDPAVVNELNHFNVSIAKKRADLFFRNGLRLANIMGKDVTINTIVLALLGDFFSNDIHEELVETAELLPMDAVILAQDLIASGIRFLLQNSNVNLVIPCHSGNHSRTTKKTHFTTEAGHSLEFFMYHNLKKFFADEPRVEFLIPTSYHSYVEVLGRTIRFHHGHSIRYAGGVGGLYIPTNKAIAQWNKGKHADLDVFGHFHQLRDGGNFICNGSLIGYNAFAISIKAEYERPQQSFFLIDKKRGRTISGPILFE